MNNLKRLKVLIYEIHEGDTSKDAKLVVKQALDNAKRERSKGCLFVVLTSAKNFYFPREVRRKQDIDYYMSKNYPTERHFRIYDIDRFIDKLSSSFSKKEGEDGKDYVYHSSPNPNITTFKPRPFVHSEDYSESGAYIEGQKIPKGFKKSNLFYAATKSEIPFYSLPRNVPRMFLGTSEEDQEASKELLKKFPEIKLDKKNLFVSEKYKKSLENHSWTIYKFNKGDFEELPGGIEYITRKEVKPLSKFIGRNTTEYLRKRGWNVVFVPSVHKITKYLRSKGHYPNAENID